MHVPYVHTLPSLVLQKRVLHSMKIIILAPDRTVSLKEKFPESTYGDWKDDTVQCVADALKKNGFEVQLLECSLSLIDDLLKTEKSLVFNVCDDGFRNDPRTEPLVAGVIELSGFPYTGSDMFALSLAQNKRLCKDLMAVNKVRTPRYWYVEKESDLEKIKSDKKLIVKPNFQDGSIGITQSSVVDSKKALDAQAKKILKNYGPALIEEFIAGREFIVGIIGDKVLPITEVISPNKYNLKDEDVKWNVESEAYKQVKFEIREVGKKTENEMIKNSLKMKEVINCHDYSRFDFRVDKNGRSYLLDVNPNPGLTSDSSLAFMMKAIGRTYDDLIRDIVESALRRYKTGGKR